MLTRDHTVVPVTHAFIRKLNEPSCFDPQPQHITTLWPVLISHPTEGRRLSWPGWVVTYRDGVPSRRWSPIPVPTDRYCSDQALSSRPLSHEFDALTTKLPNQSMCVQSAEPYECSRKTLRDT